MFLTNDMFCLVSFLLLLLFWSDGVTFLPALFSCYLVILDISFVIEKYKEWDLKQSHEFKGGCIF